MNARNSAEWRAALRPRCFALDIVPSVLIEWNAGPPALLRTVMHQTLFADIQEPAASAAVPVVWQTASDILLKMVEMSERKQTGFKAPETVIDTSLLLRERLKLAAMIVQNTDRAGKAEFPGASPDHDRVLRVSNSGAQHGVDGDSEVGVLREPFEFPVKHAQALFRDVVGRNVVDADLQIVQSGAIEGPDPIRGQEQTVGDQSRDRAAVANSSNDRIEIRMQRRLAAAQRDDSCAKIGQAIDPPQHGFEWHGGRMFVVFIAIGAIQVAAPDGHDLCQNRVRGRLHGAHEHARLAELEVEPPDQAH